jgi:hypothetical protein
MPSRRINIRSRARALILPLAACFTAFAQSAPPADQNSASADGVVVNAATGGPVLRAHVVLFSFTREKQATYGAMTTAEGKFSVTGLPAGNYAITVNRLGFVFNQRGSNGFFLKAGDHKEGVTLKLTPTGAVSGTVMDADGEPVENCNVMAESNHGDFGTRSDSQGKFRIGGIIPGKYRIKATPDELQTPPEIRTDGSTEVHYSQTYYPNTLDEAGAAKVGVEGGAETSGIEIRLARTPIVRVSGKVTGMPPGAEGVFLMVQRGPDITQSSGVGFVRNNGWSSSGGPVKKDGTFALWRLAPGPYRIGVQWNSPAGQMAAAAPVDIVVGDSNIDGVELRMAPAADLTGQVDYESDDARPAAPPEETQPARRNTPQVLLQGIDGTNWAANGQVDSTGAFTLAKVPPGRYQVTWNGGFGYVKSMRLGTTEIAGHTLDLSGGVAGVALTVVISAQFGSVSGTVQTDGAATAGLMVVLLPDSQEQDGRGRYASNNLATDGSYSFDDVVPGTYKLAVIAQDDLNAIMQGGDEWDAYAPVTQTVTIRAGEKTTQDLKILTRQ